MNINISVFSTIFFNIDRLAINTDINIFAIILYVDCLAIITNMNIFNIFPNLNTRAIIPDSYVLTRSINSIVFSIS